LPEAEWRLKMNKKLLTVITVLFLLIVVLLLGCERQSNVVDDRVSAVVMFVHSSQEVKEWLKEPKSSYIQAYFRFLDDLASDVLFGLDLELLEGNNNPIHFQGADWMGLAGLKRTGHLCFLKRDETFPTTPGEGTWEVIDLQIKLEPNTWYFMRLEADFEQGKFVRFSINGSGIDKSVDLQKYNLDYPNYLPITDRTMTYYVFAARNKNEKQTGNTVVYWDDIEAGIETTSGWKVVLNDGFENQDMIGKDITSAWDDEKQVFDLSRIPENFWLRERPESIVSLVTSPVRNGSHSCACDATLINPE